MNRDEIIKIVENEVLRANRDYSIVPPLFHGTTRIALEMTDEERRSFKDACEVMLNYLLGIAERNGCDAAHFGTKEALGEDYKAISEATRKAFLRRNGAKGYSYGHACFTNDPFRALNYAYLAVIFGETGFETFWTKKGVEKMGFIMPEKTQKEKEAFALFEEYLLKDDEPVTLMFTGLKREDFNTEHDGSVFDFGPLTTISLKYLKDINLDGGIRITISEAEAIKKHLHILDRVLTDRKLEKYSNYNIKITMINGETLFGEFEWCSKEQYARELGKIDGTEEALTTPNEIIPKSCIYMIEDPKGLLPEYHSQQYFMDQININKRK